MKKEIGIIYASKKYPYLALSVQRSEIESYITQMEKYLKSRFSSYRYNQIKRDGKKFHMTIVSPRESSSSELFSNKFNKKEIEINMLGLGACSNGSGESVYIIVDSDEASNMRKAMGLGSRDFHITLGFSNKDIHDVDKGITTKVDIQ